MNNIIPAVERTIALLDHLSEQKGGATQAQLKKQLGISMSSTYRILQTLLASHWVRKRGDGAYLPGSGLLPLLNRVHGGAKMLDHLQSVIDRMAQDHGITCKISVRRGGEQVTLMRAESDALVVLTGRTGARFPVVEGSVGAALLYLETKEHLRELLDACPEDIPEKNKPAILFRGIRSVRDDGHAINKNNRWKITALSAPVHHTDGTVLAALTFVIPQSSSRKLNQLGALLKEAARECEESIIPTKEHHEKQH